MYCDLLVTLVLAHGLGPHLNSYGLVLGFGLGAYGLGHGVLVLVLVILQTCIYIIWKRKQNWESANLAKYKVWNKIYSWHRFSISYWLVWHFSFAMNEYIHLYRANKTQSAEAHCTLHCFLVLVSIHSNLGFAAGPHWRTFVPPTLLLHAPTNLKSWIRPYSCTYGKFALYV